MIDLVLVLNLMLNKQQLRIVLFPLLDCFLSFFLFWHSPTLLATVMMQGLFNSYDFDVSFEFEAGQAAAGPRVSGLSLCSFCYFPTLLVTVNMHSLFSSYDFDVSFSLKLEFEAGQATARSNSDFSFVLLLSPNSACYMNATYALLFLAAYTTDP